MGRDAPLMLPVPAPRSMGTPKAPKCFNLLYQPPAAFPPHLSFGLPTGKRGARLAGHAPSGPPHWAWPSGLESQSFCRNAERAALLWSRLLRRRSRWVCPPAPLGPLALGCSSSSEPDPSNTSACLAPQAISWTPRPGTGATAP